MSLMQDYVKKRLSGRELEKELERLIKVYNKKEKAELLIYASALGKGNIPDISMTMDDYYTIFDILREIDNEELHFYLETPGGSGEAAEEIERCLIERFKDIVFVISGEAKSAGTILALSGDDIHMTKTGSLGPIDAQIKIGRTVVSAYDYIEWVEEIRKKANKERSLNPFDATLIAQISPGEIKRVGHALVFAKDLVKEWIPKYKFKHWNETETQKQKVTNEMKIKRAEEIANKLIDHSNWRTHGRSIKIKDLKEIGLRIGDLDLEKPETAEIVYRIHTVVRLLFLSSSTYKIFGTKNGIISKQAVSKAQNAHPVPSKDIGAIEGKIGCPKCKKTYKMIGLFNPNPAIKEDAKKKGFTPFPKNNILNCECGAELDLTGLKNELEKKVGKKVF